MNENAHTWHEIVSQPTVWRHTLQRFEADRASLVDFVDRSAFDHVVAIGCGSTHYLAQAAATTLSHATGIPAQALPSSEVWLFPDRIRSHRPLLLAISRSGTTTETLWAVDRFRQMHAGPVLAVTCYPESPLASRCDLALTAPDAQEESVAQTRSFVSMFILTQAMATAIAQGEDGLTHLQQLPDRLVDLEQRMGDLPRQLGADLKIEQFFFLGGGPLYGLASEVMLKVKEMTLSHSQAFHPLEFRHGPMSMVTDRTLIVGLLSDTGLKAEGQVLQDMAELGARTLALVEDASAFSDWRPDDVIELQSGMSEWERGALYLPPLQRMAYHRAVAKGLNPDRPTNLEQVVEL